jgi:hypothetical protein
MVPNHVVLELLAKDIHQTRVREADARRRIATAHGTSPVEQRSPAVIWIVNGGSRIRWWFRSRTLGPQAPVEPNLPTVAAVLTTTISLDTVSASGAMLPAGSYEALMVIARGSRQRHERLVPRRS